MMAHQRGAGKTGPHAPAMEVIDDAIQIMGGLGYTDEARVSRFWRDVRCERIGGGTDEIIIYAAGRQYLKTIRTNTVGGAAS